MENEKHFTFLVHFLTWWRETWLSLKPEEFLAQKVDEFRHDSGILELDAVDEPTRYLGNLRVPDS